MTVELIPKSIQFTNSERPRISLRSFFLAFSKEKGTTIQSENIILNSFEYLSTVVLNLR